jgi:hypothetical protein
MMNLKLLIYLIFFIGVTAFFYNYPINYKYIDYKEFLTVLLTVSSMVFTLMGIWIAFLYPNALQRVIDPLTIENADFSVALTETRRLEGLVASVLKSALVVITIVFIYLLKILFFQTDLYLSNVDLIKSGALTTVIVLSFIQFESILYVIYSNVMFLNELHSKREDRQADADI